MTILPGLPDAAILLVTVAMFLAFGAGFAFGWAARGVERNVELDLTGRLMTPPEDDSQFPDPLKPPVGPRPVEIRDGFKFFGLPTSSRSETQSKDHNKPRRLKALL